MRRKDIAIILRLVADSLYIFGFLLLVPLSIALATAEYVEALAFAPFPAPLDIFRKFIYSRVNLIRATQSQRIPLQNDELPPK
jgi:hypothetical protein